MSDNSNRVKIICITKDELQSVKKQIFDKFSDIPIKQAVDEILKDSPAQYRQAILEALKERSEDLQRKLREEIIVYRVTREKKLRRVKSKREQISLLSPSAEYFLKTTDQYFGFIRKHHLWRCRQEYKETKNPLFVWDVYYHCQQWDIPVPKWVSAYLAGVATKILKATKTWVKGADRSDRVIPLALGFAQGGGSSKFKQYNRSMRDQEIYYRSLSVQEEMEAEKKAGWVKPQGETEFDRVSALLKKEGITLSAPTCGKIFKKEKEKTSLFFIEDNSLDFD